MNQKPEKCPRCESESVAKHFSDSKLKNLLQNGISILGGRSIEPVNPDWKCQACNHDWGDGPQE
jgi:transposase-like protein